MIDKKDILTIYKQKRYKVISEDLMEIDGHTVGNKRMLTCTCTRQTFTDQEGLCRHKLFFIIFPILDLYNKKIEELVSLYEIQKYSSISKDDLVFMILDDLDKLRRLK